MWTSLRVERVTCLLAHLRKIKRDGSLQVAAARLTREELQEFQSGLKLLKPRDESSEGAALGKGKPGQQAMEKEPAAKRLKKEDSDVTLNSQGFPALFDSPFEKRAAALEKAASAQGDKKATAALEKAASVKGHKMAAAALEKAASVKGHKKAAAALEKAASRKEEQLASSESACSSSQERPGLESPALVSRARAAGSRVAHLEAKELARTLAVQFRLSSFL